jgi:cell division protein FtsW (lipid II flippase)
MKRAATRTRLPRKPTPQERARSAPQHGKEASAAALGLAVLTLTSIGTVAVFSATAPLALEQALPPHFLRHAAAVLLGGVVIVSAARIPLPAWHRLALPLWAFSLLLLGATLVVGLSGGGAARWLSVPGLGFAFQPVEFAKLSTVLAVAALLGRRDGRAAVVSRDRLAVALALGLAPAAIAILQPTSGMPCC